MTFTVVLHEICPAARLPLAWMLCLPGVAVTVPAGQVDDPAAGFATCRPAATVSTNDHPLFAVSSAVFVTVNVSCVGRPSETVAAPNALSKAGCAGKRERLNGFELDLVCARVIALVGVGRHDVVVVGSCVARELPELARHEPRWRPRSARRRTGWG